MWQWIKNFFKQVKKVEQESIPATVMETVNGRRPNTKG